MDTFRKEKEKQPLKLKTFGNQKPDKVIWFIQNNTHVIVYFKMKKSKEICIQSEKSEEKQKNMIAIMKCNAITVIVFIYNLLLSVI